MSKPVTIAIDAMSGDRGASVVVHAALEAVRENEALSLVLVGIRSELEALLRDGHARIRIVEAADVVRMNERPSHALRHKKNSSMAIALSLVRDGEADDAQLKDCEAKVMQAVERCEKQLADGRDWLMGALTIADFETFAWLVGMEPIVPEAFKGKSETQAWMKRVKARPSVQAALARATTDAPERSWAPGPEINRWG